MFPTWHVPMLGDRSNHRRANRQIPSFLLALAGLGCFVLGGLFFGHSPPTVTNLTSSWNLRFPNGETNVVSAVSSTERLLSQTAQIESSLVQGQRILELEQQLRQVTASMASVDDLRRIERKLDALSMETNNASNANFSSAVSAVTTPTWKLAMRFKSSNSIFNFDSAYWTDSRTYNDGDPNPSLDEDAKFAVFNTHVAARIRGCLHSCLEYALPSPHSTLREVFANTPLGYNDGQNWIGNKAAALTWLASTGLPLCSSDRSPGWGEAGVNLVDTVSSYHARVRFGGVLNNEASVNSVNDAIGFGAREADGNDVGAGLACYPNQLHPMAGTIWIQEARG